MVKPGNSDPAIQTLFQLALKQQAVGEQTNRLMQSMLDDIRGVQQSGEKLAILANRIETIERSCGECKGSMLAQVRELDLKREANKDRISQVEQSYLQQVSALRSELHRELQQADEQLRNKLDSSVGTVERVISELREKVAFNAGKFGGIVALVISIVAMLLQYVLSHPSSKP